VEPIILDGRVPAVLASPRSASFVYRRNTSPGQLSH
jgi:hypothetical protein